MIRNLRQRSKLSQADTPLAPLPANGVAGAKPAAWVLPLLLCLYLAAALTHVRLMPTGETGFQNAADEAAHVNYVRILASGRLPTAHDAATDPRQQSYEWHQPPLYYSIAALLISGGPRGMRYLSVLFGLVAITLIYRTTRLLFPAEPEVAAVAGGAAALIPGHIAIFSTVNNDGLLEVCFSCALLALVISLRSGFSLWRAGWLGVALGCAMLTKATGLLLAPVTLLALPLLRRADEPWSAIARGAAWCFAVCAGICGWWYVRNAMLYHELVPVHAFEASFSGTAQASAVVRMCGGWGAYWNLVATNTYKSFWAVYGTRKTALYGLQAFLPDQVYQLMGIVCIVVLVGMGRLHLKRRELSATQLYSLWIMFALIGFVTCSFVAFLTKYFQAQGRYLYPTMSPICLIIALGWLSVFPARYRGIASIALLSLLVLFILLFLSTVQAAVG